MLLPSPLLLPHLPLPTTPCCCRHLCCRHICRYHLRHAAAVTFAAAPPLPLGQPPTCRHFLVVITRGTVIKRRWIFKECSFRHLGRRQWHLVQQSLSNKQRINKAGYTATPVACGLGRGHIWGHLITSAGVVRPQKKTKKVKCDGRTEGWRDGPTDRRTDKAGCTVA